MGAGKWVKYAPKLSHTHSQQAKIDFNPPSHNDNIKAIPSPLVKSLLPLVLSFLVYLSEFFLRYKHSFK